MAYWEHEQPNDYLRHTRFFYERIAKENGFMMEEIVPIGDGLCVIADISQKIARFEKMGKMKLLFRLFVHFLPNFYLKDITKRWVNIYWGRSLSAIVRF